MATPEDPLMIRDISIVDAPRFNNRGTADLYRTVTYYLGQHGPFIIADLKTVLTGAEVQRRMEAERQDIQAIDGIV